MNEGDAEEILSAMKGAGTAQVGLKTAIGGTRLVDMLPGEMLPRIC